MLAERFHRLTDLDLGLDIRIVVVVDHSGIRNLSDGLRLLD